MNGVLIINDEDSWLEGRGTFKPKKRTVLLFFACILIMREVYLLRSELTDLLLCLLCTLPAQSREDLVPLSLKMAD